MDPTLNRPDRGDAPYRKLRDELDLVLDDLDRDDHTRVLVVTSNGKNFCTGYEARRGWRGSCPGPLWMPGS